MDLSTKDEVKIIHWKDVEIVNFENKPNRVELTILIFENLLDLIRKSIKEVFNLKRFNIVKKCL